MFSYILLPMVIFAAGFNLDKHRFFRFGGYIAALGITGTVGIFLLIFFGSEFFTIHPLPGSGCSTGKGQGESIEEKKNRLELFGRLLLVFACSSAMGIAFGLSTSLLFKRAKVLHKEILKPVVLLLGCNYACYILTEVCEFSSIFALFEHAVGFQFRLIFYYIVCIVGARVVSISLLALAMKLLKCGERLALSGKELCMVCMAGCMRGTIAYALILRAVPPVDEQSHVDTIMVTTVFPGGRLGIVLVNCLLFGALFPLAMKFLKLEPRPEGTTDSPDASSIRTHLRRQLRTGWQQFDHRYLMPLFRPNHAERYPQALSLAETSRSTSESAS
eukprot:symbB.v1.2.008573.t2/scaffold511.1/size325556/20